MVSMAVERVKQVRDSPQDQVAEIGIIIPVASSGDVPTTDGQYGRHYVEFRRESPDSENLVLHRHKLPSKSIKGIGGHGIINEVLEMAAESVEEMGYNAIIE